MNSSSLFIFKSTFSVLINFKYILFTKFKIIGELQPSRRVWWKLNIDINWFSFILINFTLKRLPLSNWNKFKRSSIWISLTILFLWFSSRFWSNSIVLKKVLSFSLYFSIIWIILFSQENLDLNVLNLFLAIFHACNSFWIFMFILYWRINCTKYESFWSFK